MRIENLFIIGLIGYIIVNRFSPSKLFNFSAPRVKLSGFQDGKPELKITIPVFSKLPFTVPLEALQGQLMYKGTVISDFYVNNLDDLEPGQDSITFFATVTTASIIQTINDIITNAKLEDFQVKGRLTYIRNGGTIVLPVNTSFGLTDFL